MIMNEKNNLQQHLENGLYGTPILKPEERKKYLGTLRERIYGMLTVGQMQNTLFLKILQKEIRKHPTSKILLNGNLDSALLKKYLSIIQQQKASFMLVTSDSDDDLSSAGLVITSDTAVDEPVIDLAQKYPDDLEEKMPPAKTKKSFFGRFFS